MWSYLSNFVKPLALFLVASAILLFSDLDKRVVNGKDSSVSHSTDKKRFAFVSFVNAPTLERVEKGVTDGLRNLGYEDSKNYSLDSYNAQGDVATLNTIITTLENEDYDLIFTACTPTIQAVSLKIKNTPLIFTAVTDGIAAGLGKSMDDHLPNVTGISDLAPHKEMMELIREVMPEAKTLGTLYNPAEVNSVFARDDMKKQAEKHGFELISIPVNTQNEVADAASVLCGKDIDAVCQVLDNLSASSYSSIIKAANKKGLPYFGFDLPEARDGAVVVQSKDLYQTGYQAAGMAMKVLKGTEPVDIPFEYGKRLQADYNEEAASKFGVVIPDHIKQLKANNNFRKPDKNIQIAFVGFSNSSPVDDTEEGVRDLIKELGWDDVVSVDVFNAQSDMAVVSNIVDNIIAKPYDLVISACTPTSQAVAHKVNDRPVVFCTVADPVYAGLGKSFEDHPDNITGISVMADFKGTVEIIREILPNCKRLGSLFNPAEANSVASKIHLEKAVEEVGMELVTIPVGTAGEISDATIALLAKDIDAICQVTDNLTATSYSGILKEVNKTDMPYFTFMSKQVPDGAFLAVSRDYYENGKDAMRLVARILSGESPGEIPFQLVTETKVDMNSEVRDRLQLTIPEETMKRITKIVN